MAIKARVYPSHDDVVNGDDTWTEKHRVRFFGSELPQPDISLFEVTYGDGDTLAAAETKMIDAVIAEWQRVRGPLGAPTANLTRARVVFPALKRGS